MEWKSPAEDCFDACPVFESFLIEELYRYATERAYQVITDDTTVAALVVFSPGTSTFKPEAAQYGP
jgi:hypothetical protein